MNKTTNDLILITDDGTKRTSELIAECKKLFPVWSYYEDARLDLDFPPVKTARYFKNVKEADKELKNKSAEDLQEEGIECITLRERLIFELLYFKETGKHLDVSNVTLCAGSRYQDGHVPSVGWDSGRGLLGVVAFNPQGADDRLRARAQQFPNPSPLSSSIPSSDLESRLKKVEAWQENFSKTLGEGLKKMP